MRKQILIYALFSVFFIVSIVWALTCSYELTTEYPGGNIFTSTLPLDEVNSLSAFWEPGSGDVFANLSINSYTTTIPIANIGYTSTIPLSGGAYTSALPLDWPENGIIWNIPFDGTSLTLTLRPNLTNEVPAPSSMLIMLTGCILIFGMRLKKKLFAS
jgi:hypothetical protein